MTLTATEVFQNLFQSFSVFKTIPATTKYPAKRISEIKPSILSKFDQKLLKGFAPKISASAMTPTKDNTDTKSQENFGRYVLSNNAKIAQPPRSSSVNMRNTKFFPVIKGKNIFPDIIRAINGIIKIPANKKYFNILFILFWFYFYDYTIIIIHNPVLL